MEPVCTNISESPWSGAWRLAQRGQFAADDQFEDFGQDFGSGCYKPRLVDRPSPYSQLLGTKVAFSGEPEDLALKAELAAFVGVVDGEVYECRRKVDDLKAALFTTEQDLAATEAFRALHVSIFPPIHTLPARDIGCVRHGQRQVSKPREGDRHVALTNLAWPCSTPRHSRRREAKYLYALSCAIYIQYPRPSQTYLLLKSNP